MKSWKIGKFFGITLELHWTTILFLVFLVVLSPIYSYIFLILFIIISLHELSHSVVAKHYNVKVSKIILLPIGGMAVMQEERLKPKVEFLMSIAGPLFNFLFAGVVLAVASTGVLPVYNLSAWDAMTNGKIPLEFVGYTISTLFWLNWILGAFNMFIPAIPMDGGRAFRAILAMIWGYVKATRIAAITSKIITALMFLIAIFSFNIILLLVSVFIFLGANAEIEQAVNISAMTRIDMKKLIKRRSVKLKKNATVLDAIAAMRRLNVTQVFVGDYKHAVMIDDISRVNKNNWKNTLAIQLAKEVRPARLGSRPDVIMQLFTSQDIDILPVTNGKRVVGFVERDNLEKAVRVARTVMG
ncbi:MAG: site-2 protease family protein [Caldisphaeraceae archaeon]|nr:site-2 protease family protein [Caldisphaeraceae archaeon]